MFRFVEHKGYRQAYLRQIRGKYSTSIWPRIFSVSILGAASIVRAASTVEAPSILGVKSRVEVKFSPTRVLAQAHGCHIQDQYHPKHLTSSEQ